MGKTHALTAEDITAISKVAAEVAIAEYKKAEQEQQQVKVDNRLRNTKLLLENYRKFKKMAGKVEGQIDNISRSAFIYETEFNEMIVPSILESKQRTMAMVRFVDRMISEYKYECDCGNTDDVRRFNVSQRMYLIGDKITVPALATEFNISERTCYEDLKRAREEVAVLIFGVDILQVAG